LVVPGVPLQAMRRTVGFIRDALISYLPEMYRPSSAPSQSELIGPCRVACYIVATPNFVILTGSFYEYIHEAFDTMVAEPDILANPDMLLLGLV
jgi:hypothetical protein